MRVGSVRSRGRRDAAIRISAGLRRSRVAQTPHTLLADPLDRREVLRSEEVHPADVSVPLRLKLDIDAARDVVPFLEAERGGEPEKRSDLVLREILLPDKNHPPGAPEIEVRDVVPALREHLDVVSPVETEPAAVDDELPRAAHARP